MVNQSAREFGQFLSAVLVAGYGVIRRPKTGVRRVREAVRLWYSGYARGQYVDASVAKRRLDCCHVCPLFFEGRGTCGNPLDPQYPELGCYCKMSKKVKYGDARCWLDINARNADGTPDANGWEYNGIP